MHVEVPVKVNAWADAGIAPLVNAMNLIDGMFTIDSCQGHSKERPAYVSFRFQARPDTEMIMYWQLAKVLSEKAVKQCGYDLKVEWYPGNARPTAVLATSPEEVDILAECIAEIADRLNGRRMIASDDGMADKEPRSSQDHHFHQHSAT